MVANFVYRYRIRLDYSDKPVSTRGSRVKTEKLHNADLVRLFGVTKRPQQDCNLRYEGMKLNTLAIKQSTSIMWHIQYIWHLYGDNVTRKVFKLRLWGARLDTKDVSDPNFIDLRCPS